MWSIVLMMVATKKLDHWFTNPAHEYSTADSRSVVAFKASVVPGNKFMPA